MKSISQIGRALWADPGKADPIVVDTFSSVSLLELPEAELVERTAVCLLERANRTSTAVNRIREIELGGAQARGFYRLSPEERFILVALHLEHWSYARIARVLGITTEALEETAWRIRIQVSAKYPVSSSMDTPSCPEYDIRRPWPQRFLDDEYSIGSEKVFLQNHLMACQSCRRALNSCRDLYYAVDAVIPRVSDTEKGLNELVGSLQRVSRQSEIIRKRGPRPEKQGLPPLLLFLLRPDILAVMLGLFYLIRLMFRAQR